MSAGAAPWGLALRLGRRDLAQDRSRSALVVLLVSIATALLAVPAISIARALVPLGSWAITQSDGWGGHVIRDRPRAQYWVDESAVITWVIVAALAVVLAILLIAPAFLIGVRRRTGELRLLDAVGARPVDVRRTILAPALLCGLAGSVVGAGLVYAWFSWAAAAAVPQEAFAGLGAAFLAAGLGVLVSGLAAWYPAVAAARVGAPDQLVLRRVPEANVLLPWALVALGGGSALAIWGGARAAAAPVVAGVCVAEVGLILLLAAVVDLLGRVHTRRPVSTFVLRDAARHRVRVLPAAVASTTMVAGVVAALCYQATQHVRGLTAGSPGAQLETSDAPAQAALLVGGTLAVLVVTWVTTALAAQEARPELETLEAVGASPGARRRIAGAQAGLVAALAAGFGVPVGIGLGALLHHVQVNQAAFGLYYANGTAVPSPPFVVPWMPVLLLLVLLPVVVALLTAATARTGVRLSRTL